MSYAKTISIAIGLCFIALIIRSVAHAVFHVYTQKATGIAVTRRGMVEALLVSIVSGWLMGTAWYVFRVR